MPFDPRFALSIMLPLAESAKELLKLPADWKLVAPLEPNDFGFVASREGIIAISFRGTAGEGEWLEDFDGLAVPNEFGKGLVHQGFQNQYARLRPSLLAAVAVSSPYSEIWITGHSLGAALAILCASDTVIVPRKPLVYTWAGPRVGWPDFADWFDSLGIECNRIVNEWDVVPRLPSVVNGYKHVGFPVLIDGGRPPLGDQFVQIAHSLELSYRPGLARLLASKAA